MKNLILAGVLTASLTTAFAQTPAAPTSGTAKPNAALKGNSMKTEATKSVKPEMPPPATPAAPKVETPKMEASKVETPKMEAPKVETPKMETPKMETPKVETPASPMGDLKAMGTSILTELGPKLVLTKVQLPKFMGLISTFLTAKSAIMPLLKSDPMGYASKLGASQTDLMGGLKGVLSPDQMTSFMGLKPKTNDATNVLSNLFF